MKLSPIRNPNAERATASSRREVWQVNKYLWMTMGFILCYFLVAIPQGEFVVPPIAVWGLFGLGLLNAGVRSWMAYQRLGSASDRWDWYFTAIDLVLICGVIAVSRGLESDFWLLLFNLMLFEALFATRRQKMLLDAGAVLGYVAATLPYQIHVHPVADEVYVRSVATRLFFVILIGSLARRMGFQRWERERELALLREQMATGNERARIAREVHDGLGHALVSIILRLELCARLIAKAPAEAEALLKAEIPALRAAWNEGRDLAFHLRPWTADTPDETLVEMLRGHISRFAERTGLQVEFQPDPEVERLVLSPTAGFVLTRVVQEALTNAARHAEANRIVVALRCQSQNQSSTLICTLADDGRGFDAATVRVGFGIQSMQDRIAELGGTLRVESAPGKGTTVRMELPVK